jgi:ABC-type transport system substrate-binding protein
LLENLRKKAVPAANYPYPKHRRPLELAEAVAASWQERQSPGHVKTVDSLEPGWQAILVAQEIPGPDQHSLWHSTQPTNLTHYSDLKVDKLLEDGRQISDQAQRKEIYVDFQRFLVEDSPGFFLPPTDLQFQENSL